jgi:lactate dehydrogenase-like 2-hydroxyacid dehydrogenase
VTGGGQGEVVSFLDNDHVLGLAFQQLRGRTAAGEWELQEFLAPETLDPARFFTEPGLDDVQVHAPPPGYGSARDAPPDTTVLVLRRAHVTADVLAALPRLHHIQKLGTRTDNLDLAWTAAHGITVGTVARPALDSTAEHTVMLILAAVRHLRHADALTRSPTNAAPAARSNATTAHDSSRSPHRYNWTAMTELRSLQGSTVGLLGMGEVGTLVATRLRPFDCEVVYTSRTPLEPAVERSLGVRRVPQDEMLRTCDVISLHVPGTPGNQHLVDAAFLAAMKPRAHLVNTARGSLVDEPALAAALRSGHLRGAALDVHTDEPRRPDDPLLGLESVLLTPHIAGGLRSDALSEAAAVATGVRHAVSRAAAHGKDPVPR